VHLESSKENSKAAERSVQCTISDKQDINDVFPSLCQQLGVSDEASQDYCVCMRSNNTIVTRIDLRKSSVKFVSSFLTNHDLVLFQTV